MVIQYFLFVNDRHNQRQKLHCSQIDKYHQKETKLANGFEQILVALTEIQNTS